MQTAVLARRAPLLPTRRAGASARPAAAAAAHPPPRALVVRASSAPAQRQAEQHAAPSAATPQPGHTQPSPGGWMKSLLHNTAKVVAVLGVAAALVLGRCDAAHAARSAGRAGGFSAPPAASRGYSSGGGSSSYRGGYSGGYSGYSGGGMYSSPYSGVYRAPVVVPGPPLIGTPVFAPPVVVGPSVGVERTTEEVASRLADVALLCVFLALATSATRSVQRSMDGDDDDGGAGYSRPTLTRVQVGLLSLARELKHDLDRIAARADTGSSKGLHQLLQEVVLALLRNPSFCVYAAGSIKGASGTASLEAAFNAASMQERAKYEQETLVNVGGAAPRRSSYRPRVQGPQAQPDELVVVTLLVATGCKVPGLPERITDGASLRATLSALGGLQADQVLGVELLWTPQAEGDYFTRDELIRDFPHLRSL